MGTVSDPAPGKPHCEGNQALLTLGALTPLASTVVASVMTKAIRKAHIKRGPWVTNGGYEDNLTLIAAMAALTEAGSGRPSVDDALFPSLRGSGWAPAMLGAAAAGSYLATEVFDEAEAEPAPQEGQAATPGDPSLEQQPRVSREGADAPIGRST